MSTAPPNGSGPGSQESRPVETDPEVLRRWSRSTGWLVLALVLAYIGLQVPLPWRLITPIAGLAGVVGGIVLLVAAIRRRLPPMIRVSAVVGILCCGLFGLTGGAQAIFWEATATYDECRAEALTQRSSDQCLSDYEEDMLSTIPGMSP